MILSHGYPGTPLSISIPYLTLIDVRYGYAREFTYIHGFQPYPLNYYYEIEYRPESMTAYNKNNYVIHEYTGFTDVPFYRGEYFPVAPIDMLPTFCLRDQDDRIIKVHLSTDMIFYSVDVVDERNDEIINDQFSLRYFHVPHVSRKPVTIFFEDLRKSALITVFSDNLDGRRRQAVDGLGVVAQSKELKQIQEEVIVALDYFEQNQSTYPYLISVNTQVLPRRRADEL